MSKGTHYLYPAAMFSSTDPHIVTTLLGSCVAVCLFDPVKKIGGINHYMLPFWNGEGLASPKYGNIAIDKLIEKMLSYGSVKSHLVAKVFGGGEVIETEAGLFHIGERNIQIALDMLKEHRINIVASSLGGKLGRRIQFDTEEGSVLMKFIQKQNTLK